eukprot:scaffold82260_cov75-Phaeocystis_antarctica.AAC.3
MRSCYRHLKATRSHARPPAPPPSHFLCPAIAAPSPSTLRRPRRASAATESEPCPHRHYRPQLALSAPTARERQVVTPDDKYVRNVLVLLLQALVYKALFIVQIYIKCTKGKTVKGEASVTL